MNVKQSVPRKTQDVVLLVLASTLLMLGVLTGFVSGQTINDASSRDAAWYKDNPSKSTQNGKAPKDTKTEAASEKSKLKSTTKLNPAGTKKAVASRSSSAASKASGALAGSGDVQGSQVEQPGEDADADSASTNDAEPQSSGAVLPSALTLYGIWAIWATFLVAGIWESTKSLASSTTKKLTPINVTTITVASGMVLGAVLLSVSLYLKVISVGSSPPVTAADGIAKCALVLLLLNLAQVLLYRSAPTIPGAENGTPKSDSAWSSMPTMAKLSGVGATIVAAHAVGQTAAPTASYTQRGPGPQRVAQNPDLNAILSEIQAQNRHISDLQGQIGSDLTAQSNAYQDYGVKLDTHNALLASISGGVEKQVAFLNGVKAVQNKAKTVAQSNLSTLHAAMNASLDTSVEGEVAWLQGQKTRIVKQNANLKSLEDATSKALDQKDRAAIAWKQNELPFSYFDSAKDDYNRLLTRRNEERSRLQDLAYEASRHLDDFKRQLNVTASIEPARRLTEWSLTRAHNFDASPDLPVKAFEKPKIAPIEAEEKFIDELTSELSALQGQGIDADDQLWARIETFIASGKGETQAASAPIVGG